MDIESLKTAIICIHRNFQGGYIDSAEATAQDLYDRIIVAKESIEGGQVETQGRQKTEVKKCEHEWEPIPAVKCEHCGMIIED